MPTKYDASAVYDIINYLWDQLVQEGVLEDNDYYVHSFGFTVMPIIPIQELPELANHLNEQAYIIYDTMTMNSQTDRWWEKKEEVIFTIFSPNINKINEIKNLIEDKFQKMDVSAQNLNAFLGSAAVHHYKSIELVTTTISGETEHEAGRMTGEVIILANYIRNVDAAGNYS